MSRGLFLFRYQQLEPRRYIMVFVDDKFEWHAPAQITRIQRQSIKATMQGFWKFIVRWFLPLWTAGLFCVWLWRRLAFPPQVFHTLFQTLVALAVILPAGSFVLFSTYLLPRLLSTSDDRYILNSEVLFCRSPFVLSHKAIRNWKRVEQFRIVDYPELNGIRIFEFKLKSESRNDWYQFFLDPTQVDEVALKSFVEQKLTRA